MRLTTSRTSSCTMTRVAWSRVIGGGTLGASVSVAISLSLTAACRAASDEAPPSPPPPEHPVVAAATARQDASRHSGSRRFMMTERFAAMEISKVEGERSQSGLLENVLRRSSPPYDAGHARARSAGPATADAGFSRLAAPGARECCGRACDPLPELEQHRWRQHAFAPVHDRALFLPHVQSHQVREVATQHAQLLAAARG